jgi:protein involved in polysaccharide export with SLBB domain
MTSMLLVLALPQAPPPSPQAAPAAAAQPAPQEYLVGPQDKLDVIVIPDVFSDRRVTVDADGSFQYKDIGRVKAQDLTVRQIEAGVRQLLIDSKLHRDPTVKVEVVEFRSKMIYVNGEGVKSPQAFRIQGDDTLMSAIYQAGGFTAKAGPTITVRRRAAPGAKPVEIQIARADVEQGLRQAATFHLQDGDFVTVPEAGHCFVRGEVVNPNTYDISENARTVFDMINAAGGFTKFARKGDVFITRVIDGKPKKVDVAKDLLTEVLPNDVIEVPRRRW